MADFSDPTREQHLQWNHPSTLRQWNRTTEFSDSTRSPHRRKWRPNSSIWPLPSCAGSIRPSYRKTAAAQDVRQATVL